MELTMKFAINKYCSTFIIGLKGLALAFWMLTLTGCQVMGGGVIPASEYESFTPKSAEQRLMKEVKLRWEVREDVAQYCAQSIGMGREQAYITPPVACAVWHVASKECIIVTGTRTNHVALGHEVRHCFEGHFHK
jgi:hypothetical protein